MGLAVEPVQQQDGVVFVQPMVQKGLKEVPARFLRHQPVTCNSDSVQQDDKDVPVVDMGKLLQGRDSAEMERLANACKEWGFFQVVNHGIPISLLQEAREAARGFFQLSHEEKMQHAIKPGSCEGYGRHFLVSEDVVLDWVDLLYHQMQPTSARDLSAWPTKPDNYRNVMDKYSNEVQKLAEEILARISETLRLKSNFLEEKFGEDGVTQTLRVNYYPPCPQPDLVMGLSPHSDPGGITILLQDEVEGLQVRKNGDWIQVKAYPDAFVVNIADQIEIITNGRYKSVEHRAVVKSQSKERVSLAMFHSPSARALISPAPEFIDSSRPSLYSAMTFGEYKSSFLNKELKGKSHVHSLLIQKTSNEH